MKLRPILISIPILLLIVLSAPWCAAASLTVTHPKGGEILAKGQDYTITWDSDNVAGDIQIHLYKGGTSPLDFVLPLAAGTPNDGSYPFNPPDDLEDDSDYLIGISAESGTVWDFSDGFFTITSGPINQSTVSNPGFEIFETTSDGRPSTFGDWTGDGSQIITYENGITPYEGSQMLRFISSWFTPGYLTELKASQIFQLVDMSGFKTEIESGQAIATASAFFNRIQGDNETDTQFNIDIFAHSGLPDDFNAQNQNGEWLSWTGGGFIY